MLALLTAVVLSGSGAALHLDKSLDGKLPCAANAALEQAIKVRLPRVRLAKGRPSAGDLLAQISATAGGFRFEVRHADGTVAMSRDLFSGCAQLGDTGALILERYLAQISWAGRDVGLVAPSPPAPKPLRPPQPPMPPPPVVTAEVPDAGQPPPEPSRPPDDLISRIGSTPEPSGNEVISAAPPPPASPARPPPDAGTAAPPVINLPPEPPRDPIISAVELSAGGGVWFADRFAGALSLDFAIMMRERVRLGLLATVGLPLDRSVPAEMPRGTVQTIDIGAFAALGACTRTAISLCGSAIGGARVTYGAASTNPAQKARLFRTTTGALVLPELGLLGRAQYSVSLFFIALDALFGVPIGTGTLVVHGFEPNAAYTTPRVDLALQLRVGLRW